MTEEELTQRLKNIEEDYKKARQTAMHEFAHGNNTCKVGDVFTDHEGSIKVKKLSLYFPFGKKFPKIKFEGVILNKNKTPNKLGRERVAYQENEAK